MATATTNIFTKPALSTSIKTKIRWRNLLIQFKLRKKDAKVLLPLHNTEKIPVKDCTGNDIDDIVRDVVNCCVEKAAEANEKECKSKSSVKVKKRSVLRFLLATSLLSVGSSSEIICKILKTICWF